MVGIVGPCFPTVLSRIQRSTALGARHLQISLPSGGTCEPAETEAFFDAVSGAHRDCLFLHCNDSRAHYEAAECLTTIHECSHCSKRPSRCTANSWLS